MSQPEQLAVGEGRTHAVLPCYQSEPQELLTGFRGGVTSWMVLGLGSVACDILRVIGAHVLMDNGDTGQTGNGAPRGAVGSGEA